MAARRPLSPSALGAATAAKIDLAIDHSGSDAVVGASPTTPVRPASGRGGSSPMAANVAEQRLFDEDQPASKLQAKLRHRTKSVVCLLLLVVSITVPFIAWELTIGRGPSPPTFQYNQCNNTRRAAANSSGESDIYCCNGCRICDLPVNEVLFATAHNAHSSREDFFLQPNHRYGIDRALQYGYRAFLLDVCSCPPIGLVFCHGICGGGTVSTEKVFGSLRRFLYDNPHDVVLLEFQMHSTDPQWLFDLRDVIVRLGLGDFVHVHRGSFFDDWATMRELIEMDERLIMFQHNGKSKAANAEYYCIVDCYFYWTIVCMLSLISRIICLSSFLNK